MFFELIRYYFSILLKITIFQSKYDLEKPFHIIFKEFKNDLKLELLKLMTHRSSEAI